MIDGVVGVEIRVVMRDMNIFLDKGVVNVLDKCVILIVGLIVSGKLVLVILLVKCVDGVVVNVDFM